MNRRDVLRLAGGAALSLELTRIGSRPALAKDAPGFAALDLPKLTVTLNDEGYRLAPETTPAGWTLVTFDNQQSAGDNSADIMALPPGATIDGIFGAMATAVAGGPVPDWAFQAALAGAPWAPAGAAAQAIVHLTAGDWVVFNGGAPYEPVPLTVTQEAAGQAAPPLPPPDVEVALQEFAFLGLDRPIPAGPQVWNVTNPGRQPHLMNLAKLPDGTTQAQFMTNLMAMMSATPSADAGSPEAMQNVGGCSTLSPDQQLYLALDLAAGTYGAICFFPDRETGAPHLAMGMVQVFTVE